MIHTHRARIPWTWPMALALPAGAAMFVEQCNNTALTFTLKKFTSDPTLLVFLGAINVAFNFLVAPYAAWRSDHGGSNRQGWLKGQRLPYLVVGWSIMGLALIATPFAPSLWLLILCIVLWQFGMDWGYTGPWDPLYYDIIPKPQRGRAVVMRRLAMISARVVFNLVFLGKFDEVCAMHMKGMSTSDATNLRGEHLIYLCAGVMAFACAVGAYLTIKESPSATDPTQISPEENSPAVAKPSNKQYLRDLFGHKEWWPIYMLAFCVVALTLSLGNLEPLLITEQFGYPKRILGRIMTIAMIPEILLVMPLVFFLADRISRISLLKLGLIACTLHPIAYWCYVKWVAAGQIPTATEIIVFNVVGHVARMAACVTFEPLIFDLAPAEKLGTVQGGMLFVRGVLTLIITAGMGLWVKLYGYVFPVPSGYDYMSAYWYMALIGALGLVVIYLVRNLPPFSQAQAKGLTAPRCGCKCRSGGCH